MNDVAQARRRLQAASDEELRLIMGPALGSGGDL
jgi:hypothetical protein